jgi:hypothetical protein
MHDARSIVASMCLVGVNVEAVVYGSLRFLVTMTHDWLVFLARADL